MNDDLAQHFQREEAALLAKHPEWKNDPQKARAELDRLRKGAIEHYGFKPEEVAVIADHRHIDLAMDALAHRQHVAKQVAEAEAKQEADAKRQESDKREAKRRHGLREQVKGQRGRGLRNHTDAVAALVERDE